ncbi:MAG: IS3 family transposase [Gemmatimonadaceae bacterium]
MKEKHAVIAQHREQYPVALMCAALEISPSGFYAAQGRRAGAPSARAQADERLRVHVRATHAKSRQRYGAPRVHQELRAQGTRVARKRVARLMREDGLVARRPRRGVRTTDSRHGHPVAPNRLARRFAVSEIGGVDRVWVSDITYVPTQEGWLYLAAVLDAGSRRVVGWAMRGVH